MKKAVKLTNLSMKFTKTTTEQVAKLLLGAKRIALFAHTRPDGDAIGSSVALHLALTKAGIYSKVFCDTAMSEEMQQLGFAKYVHQQFEGEYDLFISVDCGDVGRIGEFGDLFVSQKNTLTIDHHIGDYYSSNNCVIHYSSTAQIIFEIISKLPIQLDDEIATALFMGLCTDTGSFSHSNTDKDSFLTASKLLEYQVDVQKINRLFFKDVSMKRSQFLGERMSKMLSLCDGKFVVIYACDQDFKKYGLSNLATEGMVDHAINVKEAVVAAAISEYAPNSFKISMRGKNFDVQRICTQFGGGGHKFASGCQINGNVYDIIDKLEREVIYYL